LVIRYEPADLAPKIPGRASPIVTKRVFNAALTLTDAKGQPQPYLATALPQLNTDSWRVSSDGRMDTTYRLRPGLTWHDGSPWSPHRA
jgi:ABC-type transport system substrate-binding protein